MIKFDYTEQTTRAQFQLIPQYLIMLVFMLITRMPRNLMLKPDLKSKMVKKTDIADIDSMMKALN